MIFFFLSIDIGSIGVIDNVLYVVPNEELSDELFKKKLTGDAIEIIKDQLNVMVIRWANRNIHLKPFPRFKG